VTNTHYSSLVTDHSANETDLERFISLANVAHVADGETLSLIIAYDIIVDNWPVITTTLGQLTCQMTAVIAVASIRSRIA